MKLSTYNINTLLIFTILFSACKKTDYLDSDNADRPPLSAKVKLVNALNSNTAINFFDFTRQINGTAIGRNTATAGYLDTQIGKVQYNTTEGTNTTYKSSYIFGGSASFVQETDKTSFSGPNGPIATYYHTLFAVPKLKPSKLNPGNRDSLVLVYDDLTAPATGKAKIRFANFSPDASNVDLTFAGGANLFTKIAYGNFGDQVVIPYDANGKAPSTIEGLSWKTLGPFKEVNAGSGLNLEVRDNSSHALVPLNGNTLTGITLEQGKIYTIFISGWKKTTLPTITAVIVKHN